MKGKKKEVELDLNDGETILIQKENQFDEFSYKQTASLVWCLMILFFIVVVALNFLFFIIGILIIGLLASPILIIVIIIWAYRNLDEDRTYYSIKYTITSERIVDTGKKEVKTIYFKDIAHIEKRKDVLSVYEKCPDGSSFLTEDKLLDDNAISILLGTDKVKRIYLRYDKNDEKAFLENCLDVLKERITFVEYTLIEQSKKKTIEQYRERGDLSDDMLQLINEHFDYLDGVYIAK